jgi:tetratricopeptide (TPR) repeat protein
MNVLLHAFQIAFSALTHPLVIIGILMASAILGHRFAIARGVLPRPSRAQARTIRMLHRTGVVATIGIVVLGVVLGGIAGQNGSSSSTGIANVKREPTLSVDSSPDPEAIVQRLEIEHPQAFESLQGLYQTEFDIWRKHVKEAVSAITTLLRTSKTPAGTDLALVALEQGQTHEASAILQVVAESAAEAAAYRQLGAMSFLDDSSKSLAAYRRAAELDQTDAESLNQLGYLSLITGDLAEAETAYRKIYDIGKARQDRRLLAIAYANMGNTYLAQGNLENSEAMYRQALAYQEALGNKEAMAFQYANLGSVDGNRGNWESAEAMHRRALELHQALGLRRELAGDYANLGNVFFNREDLAQAELMFRKALELYRALGDQEAIASNYTNLGNVYYRRGDQVQAESVFHQAQEIYRSLGPKQSASVPDERRSTNLAANHDR